MNDYKMNINGKYFENEVQLCPIGIIHPFYGTTIPYGWLECNGQVITPDNYPELCAILPNPDPGNSSYVARIVPDLRGRTIIGASNDYSLGSIGGSKDATVIAHNHGFTGNNIWGRFSFSSNDNVMKVGNLGGVAEGCFAATNDTYTNEHKTAKAYADSSGNYYGSKYTVFSATPTGSISTTGSSGTNANMQPYMALKFIIRAK